MNKVILIGNLGKNPDTRFTPSGKKVTTFSLATTERWTDQNGERQSKTTWHRVECWGRLAEIVGEYKHVGDRVAVEGRIQNDNPEPGKFFSKIVASSVEFLSRAQHNETPEPDFDPSMDSIPF